MSQPQSELPPAERNATVAVFADLAHAEAAVREFEQAGFDMTLLSIVAADITNERHVVGFDTTAQRAGRWGRWGGVSGVLIGSLCSSRASAMLPSAATCCIC